MPRTVVTIGNFDGVHRGHAALIQRARAHADAPGGNGPGGPGRVVVLSFDPHPSSVLRPGTEPARLTTFDRRAALLRHAGADEVHRLEPDDGLLSMTPEVFLNHVRDSFAPAVLVEGADFHFGKGRSGHVDELRVLGDSMGFEVDVVDPVRVDLCDQSVVTASSSITRWLLDHGRVADAARVLGRPHELRGVVVRGDRRGRTIGFPTANIAPAESPPGPGVYACRALLPCGRERPAAVHVGERPTIGDGEPRIEAHILGLPTSVDARSGGAPSPSGGPKNQTHSNSHTTPAHRSRSGLLTKDTTPAPWSPIEGLDENGWVLALRFMSRLRDPIRFGSLDGLRAQLARDCVRAEELLEGDDTAETRGARPKETCA